MKKWTLFLAAAALVLVSCGKEDADDSNKTNSGSGSNASQSELIGSWESTNPNMYSLVLKENKTYVWANGGDEEGNGAWSYDNGKLTLDEDVYDVNLIGGKAALILKSDGDPLMFYKQGATVESPQLTSGRWDAIMNDDGEDFILSLIVDANKTDSVEMCVIAWGARFWGHASIVNGVLQYDILKSQQGRNGDESGWWAGEADMDPETFELHGAGYHYIEGSEYEGAFSNIRVCVAPDGIHGYCTAVGLTKKLIKRQN